MLKSIFTFVILLSLTCTFAQNKEMQRALKKGKNSDLLYEAKFDKVVDKTKIEKWCEKKGYVLISTRKGEIARFGDIITGVISAKFRSDEDNQYLAALEKKRQEEARTSARQNRNSDGDYTTEALIMGAVGLGALLYGGYKALESIDTGSSGDTYSDNSYPGCQPNAHIHIEIEGKLEGKSKLTVTGGPEGCYIENSYDDVVWITAPYYGENAKCIAGKYSFSYTYNINSTPETVSGSFQIDGTEDSYQIVVDPFENLYIKPY